MCNLLNASLLWIDPGRFLNDSKNELGSRACSCDRWKLREGNTCADRAYKDYIAARVNFLLVQIEPLDEDRCDVKDEPYEDKSNGL